MNVLRHTLTVVIVLFLVLGVPFLNSSYFKTLVSGTDAVSSASVIVEQPSGNYIVIINLDKHTDEENLQLWRSFFKGEEISYIFEDIECSVATSDINGFTMADSFRSRLPENQMKIKTEDGTLMLSKAEYGKFDIIIMSEEIASAYTAQTLYDKGNFEVIEIKGESE